MAYLLLKNGIQLEGESIGANGSAYGEICFNTSMVGYQEILTDSSYSGHVLVMTYPEIGNIGINADDFESEKVFANGLVVKNYSELASHYKKEKTLKEFLCENNVVGLSNVDTRYLASVIRDEGVMPCLITTENITDDMKMKLQNWQIPQNIAITSSKNERKTIKGGRTHIAVVDFGLKNSILDILKNLNCTLYIYPADVKKDELLEKNPDAVIFSNGPGNPNDLTENIETIKSLIGKLPLYGIGLGFQLLALASGGEVLKLKYGHRGMSYPVVNLQTNKVVLTSQNHGFTINEETLPENSIITFKNINDGTVEGFKCPMLLIEGIQFHPTSTTGVSETQDVLTDWIFKIEEYKKCQKI